MKVVGKVILVIMLIAIGALAATAYFKWDEIKAKFEDIHTQIKEDSNKDEDTEKEPETTVRINSDSGSIKVI